MLMQWMWKTSSLNSEYIDQVSEFKLLGVTVDEHMSFSSHVENIFSKARSILYALLTLKRHVVDEASLTKFYLANIRSILCYAAPAWFSYLSDTNMNRLESIQRQFLRVSLSIPTFPATRVLFLPACHYYVTTSTAHARTLLVMSHLTQKAGCTNISQNDSLVSGDIQSGSETLQ